MKPRTRKIRSILIRNIRAAAVRPTVLAAAIPIVPQSIPSPSRRVRIASNAYVVGSTRAIGRTTSGSASTRIEDAGKGHDYEQDSLCKSLGSTSVSQHETDHEQCYHPSDRQQNGSEWNEPETEVGDVEAEQQQRGHRH
jgi:hypothetical protein